MPLQSTSLRFAGEFASVGVRELTGFDEQAVRGTGTAAAIGLLDHVVEVPPGASWRAARLTASDRDLLLAAVYRLNYGTGVDTTVNCRACGGPFDLSFSLDELLRSVYGAGESPGVERLPDGAWRAPGGARFRLPTGEDELAVAALEAPAAAQALFERCVAEAPSEPAAREAVEEALESLAPVLDLDIQTACPECGAAQALHFDLLSYLLGSIEQGREQLRREIHRLAEAYHWGLHEILGLPRGERRAFAALIDAERPARRRPV